jgi:hypothetical protein
VTGSSFCSSFCDWLSFCDFLNSLDSLSFSFCDCLLFKHSFSASVFCCIRFCDCMLIEHSFSASVSGCMSFCNCLLFERSTSVWWRLILSTEGYISQCCLPFWRLHKSVGSMGRCPSTIHGFPLRSDPICLSAYVYRNEFDYLLSKGVPSPVPSSNKGLDNSGVNRTPIHNKGLGWSTLPCHSRKTIC